MSVGARYLLCLFSAYWSTGQGRGLVQLTTVLSYMLSGGTSCELGSWMDPNKIVKNFLEPEVALPHQLMVEYSPLLAYFGSRDRKSESTPVTNKRRMAKNSFGYTCPLT